MCKRSPHPQHHKPFFEKLVKKGSNQEPFQQPIVYGLKQCSEVKSCETDPRPCVFEE